MRHSIFGLKKRVQIRLVFWNGKTLTRMHVSWLRKKSRPSTSGGERCCPPISNARCDQTLFFSYGGQLRHVYVEWTFVNIGVLSAGLHRGEVCRVLTTTCTTVATTNCKYLRYISSRYNILYLSGVVSLFDVDGVAVGCDRGVVLPQQQQHCCYNLPPLTIFINSKWEYEEARTWIAGSLSILPLLDLIAFIYWLSRAGRGSV